MKKIRIRRPLAPRPPAAKVTKFLEAGKKFQWKPGVSGNPAGARSRKGVKIRDYKSFVEDCRELSPRALARLREALELPWTKQTARTILTAAALVIERGYGRAVNVVIDATPPQAAPVIEMSDEYWRDLVGALKESGALDKPVDAPGEKFDVVDAEVVEARTNIGSSLRPKSES